MKKETICAAVLLCCLGQSVVFGDTVLLNNGAVFEGEIFEENDKQIGLRIKFGEEGEGASYIEKFFTVDRVKRLTRGNRKLISPAETTNLAPLKTETPPAEPEAEKEKEKELFPEEVTESEKKKLFEEAKSESTVEQPKLDPALADQLKAYIEDLGSADAEQQGRAQERIVAIGPDASSLLVIALAEAIQIQRIKLIETLADLGDKRTTQILIGELKGAVSQKARMEAAYTALQRITGKIFPFTPEGEKVVRDEQQKTWEAWFEVARNLNTYKNQFDKTGKLILVATEEEQ